MQHERFENAPPRTAPAFRPHRVRLVGALRVSLGDVREAAMSSTKVETWSFFAQPSTPNREHRSCASRKSTSYCCSIMLADFAEAVLSLACYTTAVVGTRSDPTRGGKGSLDCEETVHGCPLGGFPSQDLVFNKTWRTRVHSTAAVEARPAGLGDVESGDILVNYVLAFFV